MLGSPSPNTKEKMDSTKLSGVPDATRSALVLRGATDEGERRGGLGMRVDSKALLQVVLLLLLTC